MAPATTTPTVDPVKVLYWLGVPVGAETIIAGIEALSGARLTIVRTLDDVIAEVANHDALILGDAPPSDAQAVLDAAAAPGSRLRRLHFISAGREGFDAVGIPADLIVSGPNGASAPAVAEHAMALLLAMGRGIPAAVETGRTGTWDRSVSRNVRSLENETMVIVGLGHVGREVAVRARAFGMRTVGIVREQRADDAVDEVVSVSRLAEALSRADVVVVTVALTQETERLIGAREFEAMKPGALLVNVSRGRVIDQEALVSALEAGVLAGAGLDVTDPEPLPDGHPLWDAPDVLVTPHYAGAGSLTELRTATRAIEMVAGLVASTAEEQR